MDIPAEISSKNSTDGVNVDPRQGSIDLKTIFAGQPYARKIRCVGEGLLIVRLVGPLSQATPIKMPVKRGDVLDGFLFTEVMQESTCGILAVFR